MKKSLALLLVLTLMLALLAGCASTGNAGASAEKVIKIGVFEPVTGENGGGGFQEVLGMRYANTKVPSVDIGGQTYKIELVEVDNKSDKTEAVTAAQSLMSSKVAVVLGSYGSGVSIAAGEISRKTWSRPLALPAPIRRPPLATTIISEFASWTPSRVPSWPTSRWNLAPRMLLSSPSSATTTAPAWATSS